MIFFLVTLVWWNAVIHFSTLNQPSLPGTNLTSSRCIILCWIHLLAFPIRLPDPQIPAHWPLRTLPCPELCLCSNHRPSLPQQPEALTQQKTNPERIWTLGNKGRVLEGMWVGECSSPVMGITEGTCCDEHWVLHATNESLSTTSKTNNVLYAG